MFSRSRSAVLIQTKGLGSASWGVEEEQDRGVQLAQAAIGAAPDLFFGEDREPALDLVDRGRIGGCEVEMEARAPDQPAVDQGRLVGAVVVEHEMDFDTRRYLLVDAIQKSSESVDR